MATVLPIASNGDIDLTEEEAHALFDREAHRRLGMSGEAFVDAWKAGQFDDDPERPAVMYMAMLLPLVQ